MQEIDQPIAGNVIQGSENKRKEKNIYRNPALYKFNCECGKNFNYKKHLNAHIKKFHNQNEVNNTPNTNKSINPKTACQKKSQNQNEVEGRLNTNDSTNHQNLCILCGVTTRLRRDIVKHYKTIHDISLVEEKFTFASDDEFFAWKNKLESDTCSRYVNKGTQKLLTSTVTTFPCHRSGYYNARGKGLRSLKVKGSVKINGYCPSRIMKKRFDDDGTCVVNYCKTHVGHVNEIKHITLTPAEKDELANKISMNIPFDDILDEVQDSMYSTSNLQRKHLLTRKDLHNIGIAYNLEPKTVQQKEDDVSVDVWIQEMQSQGNCVMFYKPQGVSSKNLKPDDFVLMIMTEAQLEILKKFGNDLVCLTGTRGINNFKLNSLLILDELSEGFPCAFLISNRSDSQIVNFFFERIREQLGEGLEPKVFMSDLADRYYNAWVRVMGIPEKRLFCTWNVDALWRGNLNKINSKENQIIIYKHLRTLLTEQDPSAFQKMLREFCSIDDEEFAEFIEYFKESYVHNCEYWAYSYRLDAGINNNIHLERMHSALKYTWSKRQKENKLDKAIAAVMRLIKDKLINRVSETNNGRIYSNISSRHLTMEKMNPCSVMSSGDGWEIMSQRLSEIYFVKKQETSCENCQLVCSECNVCLHQFQCSCVDSAIKYNMCKHIHLVAKSIKDQPIVKTEVPECIEDDVDSPMEFKPDIYDDCKSTIAAYQDLEAQKEALQAAIQQTLSSISNMQELEVVEKAFAQTGPLLAALRGQTSESFEVKPSIAAIDNIVPEILNVFSTKETR